jgi:hypothetical protein
VLLAFDLRGDFQEHFANVISCLTDMLRSCRAENNDAHRIKVRIYYTLFRYFITIAQSIFDCLGFLYKYLRKELTLNFGQTFDCVAPLLGESQQYIRSFAAPGLAFLIRSHTNVAFAIDLMLQSCMCKSRQDVNYLEGVAFTLFESIKGPRHTFHSKTREIIQTMLTHVVNLPNSDGKVS